MSAQSWFEAPLEQGGIVFPGLPVLPLGVERHPVPGGGSRAVPVHAGDEICLLNREGMQLAELVLFAPDGRSDAAMLGSISQGRPEGIIATLSRGGGSSGKRVLQVLSACGFDLVRGEAVHAFSECEQAGALAEFTANSDGLLIVAAPGEPMKPYEHNTPSEIVLYIRRVYPLLSKPDIGPPDPLADPLLDKNIQPGNACAYEIKAGQYIQIVDIKGRQCSDFQVFSRRALDKGQECAIDPTATRSLMGYLYPGPGLFSKYWSYNFEPLVEIVQDSCGRHDTFGLACNARYYEDLGYPGHINCSDNINRALKEYEISPRRGWPAINFFFNTMLDDTNLISMDDPWSRPGDYVLLRALSDLVCVSTSCPCDVDPANAWNPTDIQIRAYGAQEDFKPSSGFRKSVEADMEDTRQTGFHSSFARHTRDFTEYNGYWLADTIPNLGTIGEYWACREKAAVMDLSPLRKYEVTGPDAEALMQYCVTRNIKKLSIGQVVYTAMCYEHGGMIDDGTVYRLGDMNFRWVGGTDTSGIWLREQAQKRGLNAWVRSSTDQLHNIAVQGPLSRKILSSVFWTAPKQPSIDELGWFRLTIARLGGIEGTAVVISRTGYSGELGYEIFCHPKDASEVFDAVWAVGEPLGMAPLGLAALDMLRIESGLIFAGSEFNDQTDPYEAGIGFTVALKTTDDDFIGRAALEERKAHPVRKLVGLDIESSLVPSPGDCIRKGRAQIGEITSATKSPILGKVIALARVDVRHSAVGTAIEVGQLDGFQKRLLAKIVPFPHFDPTKERVKAKYPDQADQ